MSLLQSEFLGTLILVLLGNGVVANVVLKGTKGHNSGWMVITTGWALAVFLGVVVAGPVSGAHLNPAVTVGLAVAGKFPWNDVAGYVIAQLGGAGTGALLVYLLYKSHFDITEDASMKLAAFSTSPAIRNNVRNLFSEALGTFVLVFVIFFFADPEIGDEGRTPIGMGSLGAIPVAFLVWSIGLSLGGTTGYAINPARDLGPRIIHALLPMQNKSKSDWGYSWIPVVGPLAGGCLAAVLYGLLN